MNVNKTWIIAVIAVDLVIVTLVAGYIMLDRLGGEMTQVTAVSPTTTLEVASPGPMWELPEFDGSVLASGSVGSEIRTSDTSWGAYDNDFSYLAIDGTPAYDLGSSVCLDDACENELDQLVNGARFVWVAESPDGFSDELSHAIAPSSESLAACWSDDFDGPVAVVLGTDGVVVDRAWVLTDTDGTTTWFGLDPSTIDRNSVLPLPFAGYDLPVC